MSAIASTPIDAEAKNAPTFGRLFFLDLSAGRILSANPDGSDLKTIINEGRRLPDGLVLDVAAGHIYWTNMGDPKRNADPKGECATLLTVFFPSEEIARQVAKELRTRVVADSGWHVYLNMEQILAKRLPIAEGCPFRFPLYTGPEEMYWRGMLPQTDALVARAINIGIGVSDPGLGSAFGVTIRDGFDTVDARATQFRDVALKYL